MQVLSEKQNFLGCHLKVQAVIPPSSTVSQLECSIGKLEKLARIRNTTKMLRGLEIVSHSESKI